MRKIKDLYQKYLIAFWTIIGIGGVFFLWWFISFLAKTTLFPGPEIVIPIFVAHLGEAETYVAIGGTLLRLVIAIALGSIFGIILGIISGLNPAFRAFIRPLIVVFRTIPTAAVIYVVIALLKPMFAPVIIVFLVAFPILYDSVVTGITNVDKSIVDALRIDGTKTFRAVTRIYLPLSWSYIVLGFVSSIGLGMKVSIMSEILAGSDSAAGLGQLIRDASTIADMKNVLAYSMFALIIIGLIDIAMHLIKKKIKQSVATNN